MSTSQYIRLWAGAMALMVMSLPCAASPNAEEVTVKKMGGPFSAYYRPGKWSQRFVFIRNAADVSRDVKVVFESQAGKQGTLIFSCIATVPPNTTRRVQLAVRPAKMPPTGQSVGGHAEIEVPVILRDAVTGRQLSQTSGRALTLDPQSNVRAIISRHSETQDTDSYLGSLNGSPLGKTQSVGLIRPDAMPNRWYGYSNIDMVIVRNVDVNDTHDSQIQALLSWVRRGGVVLLAGSTDLEQILRSPLGRAAGVTTVGYHRITSLQATEVGRKPLAPVEMQWPIPMVELVVESAEVLFEADHMPLLTHQRLGQGHVFTLAVPIGALQDKSLHVLWRPVRPWAGINKNKMIMPAINNETFLSPGRSTLTSIAGRKAPGRWTAVSILIIFASLAFFGGLVLRLKRRGELVWVVLVPLAIASGLVLWNIGKSRSDSEYISHIGLLTGLDEETARTQIVYGYYSGTSAKQLDFSSGESPAVIVDIGRRSAAGLAQSETRTGAVMSLPNQKIQPNGTKIFFVDGITKTKGITGWLTFDESGLSGELTNHLGQPVTDAVVYINRHTYRLGDLAATGQTGISITKDDHLKKVEFIKEGGPVKSRPITHWNNRNRRRQSRSPMFTGNRKTPKPVTTTIGVGQFTDSNILTQTDQLRNKFIGRLVTTPLGGRTIDRQAIIIGYAPSGPVDPLPGRKLDRQGWWAVVWPLKLAAPASGTKVLIPKGFVELKLKSIGSPVWNELRQTFNPTPRDSTLIVQAGAPSVIKNLEKAVVHLSVEIRAPGGRMTILGVPTGTPNPRQAKNAQQLKQFLHPSGMITLTVKDADRFRSSDGNYTFLLQVESLAAKVASAASGGPPVRNGAARRHVHTSQTSLQNETWTFKSINVSLEGICR